MAENSKIEWTDHSFNPWTGCTKVSPACDHCYAEGWAKRSGHVEWGPHGARRRTKPGIWNGPLKWNAEAKAKGIRYRVFCASLADVFDNHRSILPEWRRDLYDLIERTPHLDWLLLTKRPQNVKMFAPAMWLYDDWPAHVWIGTTVENQEEADRRIRHLLSIPAKVRFLSCEPLLAPLDLSPHLWGRAEPCTDCPDADCDCGAMPRHMLGEEPDLAWVICGGESGPGARPMHPDWARDLRDQCAAAGVPFFMKQWGEYLPIYDRDTDDSDWRRCDTVARQHPKGRWLNLDGGHGFHGERVVYVDRVGKKRAGRLLDGVTHDGFPEAENAL